MREPHMPGPMPPRDWNEAFAALPPETPAADALSGVFARLPAPAPERRPLRLPLALAASLLALACVPLFLRELPHASSVDPFAAKPVPARSMPTQAVVAATTPTGATPAPATPSVVETVRHADETTTHTRIAKATTPHRAKPHRAKPRRNTHATPPSDPPASTMEPLYAESARLEALLALARDDRAASATAVALGSDFEARVAGIDSALTQPSLSAQRRLGLWRERVSALRAYASFESTQRALAASGERYDAMLVSID
ncbi:MAG: hypothetical protein QM719_09985 [Thermomonas sp.]